jgi:EAL domain-containing protein (putative c-di-GMP-specific phosphodiesterase class I)
VSVNLSVQHFRQQNLGETVARVLFETGIDPGCLVLEVAEDVLTKGSHAADTTLRLLRRLRVNVAVDDFGATHSSLRRLKHWPIDTLKVDRSFVTGLGDNPDADVFVSDTINTASDLGLTVVAEGVETSRQLARLRTLGCTRAQGYYLSKPLPSEAAASLLESQFRG